MEDLVDEKPLHFLHPRVKNGRKIASLVGRYQVSKIVVVNFDEILNFETSDCHAKFSCAQGLKYHIFEDFSSMLFDSDSQSYKHKLSLFVQVCLIYICVSPLSNTLLSIFSISSLFSYHTFFIYICIST